MVRGVLVGTKAARGDATHASAEAPARLVVCTTGASHADTGHGWKDSPVSDEALPTSHVEAMSAFGRPGTPDSPADDEHDGDGLDPRQVAFCDALVIGKTLTEASAVAGVSSRTGRRWKAQKPVSDAIRTRLSEAIAVARARLAGGSAAAASALVGMSDGTLVPDHGRIASAKAVLENAVKFETIETLEARLSELEAQLQLGAGFNRGRTS
jgi:hypothetical protein